MGGDATKADDFYTLPSARQAYKNHLKTVTSRKNTVNGKVRAAPAAPSSTSNLLCVGLRIACYTNFTVCDYGDQQMLLH